MNGSNTLAIRVLGLGDSGRKAAPSVAQAVQDLWSDIASIEILDAGDDPPLVDRVIRRWCDREKVDVVLTVGRSGHEGVDFAPGLTAKLLTRGLPGVEERMHLASSRRPLDLLFCGRAGMREQTFVVNLPDRPLRARAIVRFLAPVVGHAIEKARGSERDCAAHGARA